MKNNGIQNKKRFIDITINEDEAERILEDLACLRIGITCNDTKLLIQMLEKFEKEK